MNKNLALAEVSKLAFSKGSMIYSNSTPAFAVQVLNDRNATVAQVRYGWHTATGSSKRDKGDHYDPEIGTALAVARALKNLARELEKSVNV